jgi:hypothetical protein
MPPLGEKLLKINILHYSQANSPDADGRDQTSLLITLRILIFLTHFSQGGIFLLNHERWPD